MSVLKTGRKRAAWTGTQTTTKDKSFQDSTILPDALLEIFLAFEKPHIIICKCLAQNKGTLEKRDQHRAAHK